MKMKNKGDKISFNVNLMVVKRNDNRLKSCCLKCMKPL